MASLLDQVKGKGVYESVAKDITSSVEHVGEGVAPNADGSCPHHLLVPNGNHTLCVLPSRLDVAMHYFTHGGRENLRESYEKLAARLQVRSSVNIICLFRNGLH